MGSERCQPLYGSCDLVAGHKGQHWTVGCHEGRVPPPSEVHPGAWACGMGRILVSRKRAQDRAESAEARCRALEEENRDLRRKCGDIQLHCDVHCNDAERERDEARRERDEMREVLEEAKHYWPFHDRVLCIEDRDPCKLCRALRGGEGNSDGE